MSNKNFDVPTEVTTIKDFVDRHFKSDVGVIIQPRYIIITTPSSALAGSLRMKLFELQELLGPERRLMIRIGK
jgi:hypothetical protein